MKKNSWFGLYRKLVYFFAVIICLLIIVFIIIYFCYFNGKISNDLKDWSSFASYFAGTVGISLAALNFLIIFYFTVKINLYNDQHWLTQLRSPFYKDIIDKLYLLDEEKLKDDNFLQSYILWLRNTNFKNLLFVIDEREENTLLVKQHSFLECLMAIKIDETDSETLLKRFLSTKEEFADYLGKIMMAQTS